MATKQITQRTIAAILKRRAKLAAFEKELEALESDLLSKLKSGVTVQGGTFYAEVKTWERRSPAWKQCYIRFVDETRGAGEGEKSADKVLAGTKADKFEKLDVGVAA